MAGKASSTMTADALVVFAAAAYFGLATNVTCPAAASSIPATPIISVSGEPFSNRASSADASSASFIGNSPECVSDRDCNGAGVPAEDPQIGIFQRCKKQDW